jgi:hypothetical protein
MDHFLAPLIERKTLLHKLLGVIVIDLIILPQLLNSSLLMSPPRRSALELIIILHRPISILLKDTHQNHKLQLGGEEANSLIATACQNQTEVQQYKCRKQSHSCPTHSFWIQKPQEPYQTPLKTTGNNLKR